MTRWQEKGFTLLEVLVALVIFSLLFGGLFMLIQQENRLIKKSADLLTARLLANEAMETLKTYPFEKLDRYVFVSSTKPHNMDVQIFVSDFGSNRLKKIVVTVRWIDLQGRQQYLALSTLRAQVTSNQTEGGRA